MAYQKSTYHQIQISLALRAQSVSYGLPSVPRGLQSLHSVSWRVQEALLLIEISAHLLVRLCRVRSVDRDLKDLQSDSRVNAQSTARCLRDEEWVTPWGTSAATHAMVSTTVNAQYPVCFIVDTNNGYGLCWRKGTILLVPTGGKKVQLKKGSNSARGIFCECARPIFSCVQVLTCGINSSRSSHAGSDLRPRSVQIVACLLVLS